jgi:hypothetical protein
MTVRLRHSQDVTPEKLLPQNVDAEAALLGSILIDASILPVVATIARPEDCYREAHRIIYQAMCDLCEAGTPRISSPCATNWRGAASSMRSSERAL